MIPNPGSYAVDYVRTMDKPSPYDDSPRTYTIREHRPRNVDNPNTDYVKLLVMVGGAVLAAFLYDMYKNNRSRNPEAVFGLDGLPEEEIVEENEAPIMIRNRRIDIA